MIETKPFVYLFNTYDKYYLYDANNNIIINMVKEAYGVLESELLSWDSNNSVKRIHNNEDLRKIYDEGLLRPSQIRRIEHPDIRIFENYLKKRVKLLTLQ